METLHSSTQDINLQQTLIKSDPASFTLDNKVGGYFGMNQTKTSAKFTVKSQVFMPGEHIPVTVECDNSECTNAIKSFKFKVWRKVRYMQSNG